MKIPKTVCVFLMLLFIFQAQAGDNCFSAISEPDLDGMWMSEEGYRLAAGQTHMDFGEARFYHDGDTLYVYIRNDQLYGSDANVKFDVEDNLADLNSKSNQMNKQKVSVSSSTPTGTELWFASSFECWDLSNQDQDPCFDDNLYISIHIDAATETVWVGTVD